MKSSVPVHRFTTSTCITLWLVFHPSDKFLVPSNSLCSSMVTEVALRYQWKYVSPVSVENIYDNGWSLAVDNDDDDDGWVYLR